MTRMELLAYLSANLFRIYTLFRFTENFFSERKTTVKWIIVSFLIYFSINSVCFLCFPMIGVNILSNLIPFFCVTLFYRSKTSVRVLITVIVYSISIFADIALFSVVACHAKRKKLTRKTKKTLLNTTFKSVFYYL